MRLPYTPTEPTPSSPEEEAIISRVLNRRGSRGLIALDRALLHSPPVADGWNSFLGSIRTGTSLPADTLELAICRVAVLNGAWYEWAAHAPLALAAGVREQDLERLKVDTTKVEYRGAGFGEKQMAVLEYTDAMTRDVKVSDKVFGKLKTLFVEREIVEITATIAAYNCVSRFLVALDVGEMNDKLPNLANP
jgi:alkylhydroperoxidase family enzyme